MLCEVCKTNEAWIRITDVGNFCLACNNEYMAELMGVSKLDDFDRMVSFKDEGRKTHRFEISNMLMLGFSQWRAEEVGGGYQFEVMTRPEDNQENAVRSLHQKIREGLGYRTLIAYDDSRQIGNAIRIGKKQYGLHSTGTFRIEHDRVDCVNLIIDGKTVSLKDFGRALTSFEGFNMDYQVKPQTDGILGKAMVLMPVSIDPDTIMERFERTLSWFLNRGFLSYKVEHACWEALMERIDELEVLYQYGDRDEGVELGERMKERLLSIEHDTEDFPESVIARIDDVTRFPI